MTNLVGRIIFAQPVDQSLPVSTYIVCVQTPNYLILVSTQGGLLSAQRRTVTLNPKTASPWKVIAHFSDDGLLEYVINSMTAVLTNDALAVTPEGRDEVLDTREVLVDLLEAQLLERRIGNRKILDKELEESRAREDSHLKKLCAALRCDPNPPPQPEPVHEAQSVGVDVDKVGVNISVSSSDPDVVRRVTDDIRRRLKESK